MHSHTVTKWSLSQKYKSWFNIQKVANMEKDFWNDKSEMLGKYYPLKQ